MKWFILFDNKEKRKYSYIRKKIKWKKMKNESRSICEWSSDRFLIKGFIYFIIYTVIIEINIV